LLALAALREKKTEVARLQFKELVAEFPENPLFANELAKLPVSSTATLSRQRLGIQLDSQELRNCGPPLRRFESTFGGWATIEFCRRMLAIQRAKGFRDFQEDFAEPDTAGVGVAAGWMEDIFVKSADAERNWERVDMENSRVGMNEAFWQDGDQIGLRDYVQSLQIVRNC
jgi:hypothetical protein